MDGHEFGFQYLSPLNITIAVYIMIQKSMIIYDYHKDWRRISSLFFIMVAAVDIGSACLEIGRGSISFLDGPVYENASLDFSGLPPAWYTLLRYFTFFVVALTVVKPST